VQKEGVAAIIKGHGYNKRYCTVVEEMMVSSPTMYELASRHIHDEEEKQIKRNAKELLPLRSCLECKRPQFVAP
jgi:ribosomal protein S3AE